MDIKDLTPEQVLNDLDVQSAFKTSGAQQRIDALVSAIQDEAKIYQELRAAVPKDAADAEDQQIKLTQKFLERIAPFLAVLPRAPEEPSTEEVLLWLNSQISRREKRDLASFVGRKATKWGAIACAAGLVGIVIGIPGSTVVAKTGLIGMAGGVAIDLGASNLDALQLRIESFMDKVRAPHPDDREKVAARQARVAFLFG